MCKEMPVIPVERVVDKERIIGNKNGWPRRRRGKGGRWPLKTTIPHQVSPDEQGQVKSSEAV
jgi:hypothetical protein